jgi:hypothetical protein
MATISKLLPGPTNIHHVYAPLDTFDKDDGYGFKERDELGVARIYLSVYKKENIGIMTSYLCVGFAMYFAGTPLNYYLVTDQDASSAQLGVLATLMGLPWSFKIFYGLLSDTTPIFGYRRKPYLIIGWTMYILSNLILASLGKPSVVITIIGCFMAQCGLLLADVATDTLCVERARLESDMNKGNLQTSGYTHRSIGMVAGAMLGALVYNKDVWGWGLSISRILVVNAAFPLLLVLPSSMPLVELASTNPSITVAELAGMYAEYKTCKASQS